MHDIDILVVCQHGTSVNINNYVESLTNIG